MSYNDFDLSQSDASPIECFKFTGRKIYRYVNSDKAETIGGELYEPTQIKMTSIVVDNSLSANMNASISLPYDLELATDYGFLDFPAELEVEVRRVHRGSNFATDSRRIYKGRATSFSFAGWVFSINVQNIVQSKLNSMCNSAFLGTICNFRIYDEMCGVSKAAFSHSGTVTVVGNKSFTVDNDGFINNELSGGEARNTRTNEVRTILGNLENVVNLAIQFSDIEVGDVIVLSLGCDRTLTMCEQRFNNEARNGGFPYLPQNDEL